MGLNQILFISILVIGINFNQNEYAFGAKIEENNRTWSDENVISLPIRGKNEVIRESLTSLSGNAFISPRKKEEVASYNNTIGEKLNLQLNRSEYQLKETTKMGDDSRVVQSLNRKSQGLQASDNTARKGFVETSMQHDLDTEEGSFLSNKLTMVTTSGYDDARVAAMQNMNTYVKRIGGASTTKEINRIGPFSLRNFQAANNVIQSDPVPPTKPSSANLISLVKGSPFWPVKEMLFNKKRQSPNANTRWANNKKKVAMDDNMERRKRVSKAQLITKGAPSGNDSHSLDNKKVKGEFSIIDKQLSMDQMASITTTQNNPVTTQASIAEGEKAGGIHTTPSASNRTIPLQVTRDSHTTIPSTTSPSRISLGESFSDSASVNFIATTTPLFTLPTQTTGGGHFRGPADWNKSYGIVNDNKSKNFGTVKYVNESRLSPIANLKSRLDRNNKFTTPSPSSFTTAPISMEAARDLDLYGTFITPKSEVSEDNITMWVNNSESGVSGVGGMMWPVKKEAVVEGDLVLGGLMMVHEREDNVTCGPVMPQGGIQALEAMLYTLDRLNFALDPLLPNVTIGAHILDDCDKDTYGLEMAVDFIKGKQFDGMVF